MRITIEVDDEQIRRMLGPLLRAARDAEAQVLPDLRTPGSTRLLTVKDVAVQLGVSRAKAYQLVMSAAIPSLTIGRSRRIPQAALDEFIAGRVDVSR